MSSLPPLPPGFQLDAAPAENPAAGGMPALPPGFVMDGPSQPTGQQPQASQAPTQKALVLGPNIGGVPLNLDKLPAIGPALGMLGLGGPHIEDVGADPQARYDAALAKVRAEQYPDMSDDAFKRYAEQNLGPYGLNELSAHGMLYGAADEIGAGIGALGSQLRKTFTGQGQDFGQAFGTLEELEQARRDLGRQQQGALGNATEIVSGIASMGPKWGRPGMAVPATPSGFAQTLKSGAQAAATGGAYGFGATDGDLGQRAVGAGAGAILSTAGAVAVPAAMRTVQGVARGAEQRAMTRQAVRSAPTAAEIKAGSKASYKAAESTGAIIDMPALQLLRKDIERVAQNEAIILPVSGKVAGGVPKAKAALKALREYTSAPMSMKAAQQLLKAFRRVAADPAESAVGMQMLERLDVFFDNLPAAAFSKGSGLDAIRHWTVAKTQWARFKRTDTIEQALNNARLNKGGLAAGLRSQFATILKSAKKRRGFSADDIRAMDAFVTTGNADDLMEFIGGHGAFGAALTGHAIGGPVGAAVGAAAHRFTRRAITSGQARRANDAAQVIRAQVALPNGLPTLPPAPPVPRIAAQFGSRAANPALDDLRAGLVPRLALAGRR